MNKDTSACFCHNHLKERIVTVKAVGDLMVHKKSAAVIAMLVIASPQQMLNTFYTRRVSNISKDIHESCVNCTMFRS